MQPFTLLTDLDLHLFNEGTHSRLYEKLGAHPVNHISQLGTYFAVWAPNARSVSVLGDFNAWQSGRDQLAARGTSGIWEGFIPSVQSGALYKFAIESQVNDCRVDKADPLAFASEVPPATASVVCDLQFEWTDASWLDRRRDVNRLDSPISIYEVHLGSWRRSAGRFLTYRELAEQLPAYVQSLGFTHVEFLPIMEHPFYGSWGYQTTGYFSPTGRYGAPADFAHLIDAFHSRGIAVIIDWVPSHFPTDEHGLSFFDGTHLYEHEDPRLGFHPDWHSGIFNYSRSEVRSFLLSSAAFWVDRYHADAVRVDAVASMLYRDYSRKRGEWIANKYGGRENLEAIAFLRQLNETLYSEFPSVQTIAEESTAWPMVSRPVYLGGLGFGFKWDMGWMHDTLQYMSQDPFFRKYHQHELTFRMVYAFSENFVLPLSHDEVVYGKGSLITKMPGDSWQRFANLRLLLAYMYMQPGKKLLFMGGEFGQWAEWNHDSELDWGLLSIPAHARLQLLVGELNHIYRSRRALHGCEAVPAGFEWIDCHDAEKNVISFLRKAEPEHGTLVVVCNFSPVVRTSYRIGVPTRGYWSEILNTDATDFGGSGTGNFGGVASVPIPLHGRLHSITVDLPALAAIVFWAEHSSD